MILINSQQAKELDRFSEEAGVSVATLMQNAGRAVADEIKKRAKLNEGPVVFFVGKGNNGGDAKVAAKLLAQAQYQTVLIEDGADLAPFLPRIQQAKWIVDGLLGTGLKGAPRGWYERAIRVINESKKKVLSIDIPSGLSADKGIPLGETVRATVTVCLGGIKLGCFLHPGCEWAGEIVNADIGIPAAAYQRVAFPFQKLEPQHFKQFLQQRPLASHKGSFGHVLVVAGSTAMPGAGFLASMAALRAGAGKVTFCVPERAYQKFDPEYAEVMIAPIADEGKGFFTKASLEPLEKFGADKDVVLLGPGLGRNEETISFVREFLARIAKPVVLDADGLFSIAGETRILKSRTADTILTPHLGEMSQLTGWSSQELESGKVQLALDCALLWKSILLLKGYRSLVAMSSGELFVNPTGNPGMATAGMGDVLAGLIAGFLAQGLPAKEATLAGVYLHGLAGDRLAQQKGERGLIASDVAKTIPEMIKSL